MVLFVWYMFFHGTGCLSGPPPPEHWGGFTQAHWFCCFTVLQEAIIGGLHAETTYSVTVAAYTTKGDGARSKAKVITTTGAGQRQFYCFHWGVNLTFNVSAWMQVLSAVTRQVAHSGFIYFVYINCSVSQLAVFFVSAHKILLLL